MASASSMYRHLLAQFYACLLWTSIITYLLHPSVTIHGILSVQFTWLTVFFHNLSQSFLWSTSWLGTLYFIPIHFFTQSLSSNRSIYPYYRNQFCCSMSSNPSLSLNPLLGTLSCSLTTCIHLTILICGRWSVTSFSFLTGQVSLPCNIILRTQLCTISLSLSVISNKTGRVPDPWKPVALTLDLHNNKGIWPAENLPQFFFKRFFSVSTWSNSVKNVTLYDNWKPASYQLVLAKRSLNRCNSSSSSNSIRIFISPVRQHWIQQTSQIRS